MKYIYKPHSSKLATLMVSFGAGSRVEFNSKYPKGIAHFSEHALFKGTKSFTAKDLMRQMALYGGVWNAFTCNDIVNFHITIPEENLEHGTRILSDLIFNPVFPPDEMEKEKEVVCQEIRMYDDEIDTLVQNRVMSGVFDNSLATPVIGFEDTVRSITAQDLSDFNAEFYSKSKMLIVLSAQALNQEIIEQHFGPIEGTFDYAPKDKQKVYGANFSDQVVKEGTLQNNICIGFGNTNLYELGKHEAKTELFNRIFGSGDVSRLFMKVREDLGLVYGIGSSLSEYFDGSIFTINTLTEPKNTPKVIDAVNSEIDRMCNEVPSEEELCMARNKLKSKIYSGAETSYGKAINTLYEEFYGLKSRETILEEANKVTPEDILEVAKVIFSGNKYQVIGTGGEK